VLAFSPIIFEVVSEDINQKFSTEWKLPVTRHVLKMRQNL